MKKSFLSCFCRLACFAGLAALLLIAAGPRVSSADDFRISYWTWTASDAKFVAGDINNDGNADIVGIQGKNSKIQFLTAISTFSAPITYTYGVDTGTKDKYDEPIVTPWIFYTDYTWDSKSTWLSGKLKGASQADIVVGVQGKNGYVQLITAEYISGKDYTVTALPETPTNKNSIAYSTSNKWFLGDANGDGFDDIIGVRSNGGKVQFITILSNGDGTYAFPPKLSTVTTLSWDTNGKWFAGKTNGKASILGVRNNGGKIQLVTVFSDSTGTYGTPVVTATALSWSNNSKWTTGDVNSDGIADILGARSDSGKMQLVFTLGQADGSYNVTTKTTSLPWKEKSVIATGTATSGGQSYFYYADISRRESYNYSYLAACGVAYGPYFFYNYDLYTVGWNGEIVQVGTYITLDPKYIGGQTKTYFTPLYGDFQGITRLMWVDNFSKTCDGNHIFTYLPLAP